VAHPRPALEVGVQDSSRAVAISDVGKHERLCRPLGRIDNHSFQM
jgi:hypothetical protein